MAKNSLYETAVVMNDAHCPYQDNAAINGVTLLIKDVQPDIIFILGDMIDFADISKFCRNPLRKLSKEEIKDIVSSEKDGGEIVLQAAMQREFNDTYAVLCQLRNAAPSAKIKYIFGNHEYRLYRFLMEKAPELYGLTRAGADQKRKQILSVEYLLRFDELNIESVFSGGRESHVQWGDYLVLGHFNKVMKHSGYTAKALVDEKSFSLIQSHTHRMGTYYKTTFNTYQFVGHENGCLCSLTPEYVEYPNWQQGFSIVHKKKMGDRFHIQPVPIVDHKFFWGETEYDGVEGTRNGDRSVNRKVPTKEVDRGLVVSLASTPAKAARKCVRRPKVKCLSRVARKELKRSIKSRYPRLGD